jgi:hypothetical protein
MVAFLMQVKPIALSLPHRTNVRNGRIANDHDTPPFFIGTSAS